jgi:hypothetical protein
MQIKVLVEGPVVDEKSTYDGVGSIRVVDAMGL